jgi:peptide/nickel transport system substrate-binding protein
MHSAIDTPPWAGIEGGRPNVRDEPSRATTIGEEGASTMKRSPVSLSMIAGPLMTLAILALVPAPAAAQAKSPDTVVAALPTFGRETMDPGLAINNDMTYYGAMYDWFIGVTPDGQFSKDTGVLKDWKMSPDAKVWTLTLRSGVRWHDGREVTAEDGKFSMERYAQPDVVCTMCGALKANLDSVQVVDKYTFVVNFKRPNQFFANALAPMQGDLPILPAHHWKQVGGTEGFVKKPLGSGPWKFVDRKLGQFIEFEVNPDYWNKNRLPGFKRLRILLAPEGSSRLALVQRGDADLALMDPSLAPDIKKAGLRIMGPREVQINFAAFAQSWDPSFVTNKLEVRKAINLAIDMEALVRAIYPEATGRRALGVFGPLHEGYDATLKPYPHDPGEARRLLKSVGLDGLKVTLYQYTFAIGPEYPRVQETIAAYLEAAGFKPNLVPVDYPVVRTRLMQGKLDPPAVLGMFFMVSGSSLDNNLRILVISHKAGGIVAGYWDSATIDELYNRYLATIDSGARQQIALQINRQIHESYGYIPVSVVNQVWAVHPRVGSWQPIDGTPFQPRYETLKPR